MAQTWWWWVGFSQLAPSHRRHIPDHHSRTSSPSVTSHNAFEVTPTDTYTPRNALLSHLNTPILTKSNMAESTPVPPQIAEPAPTPIDPGLETIQNGTTDIEMKDDAPAEVLIASSVLFTYTRTRADHLKQPAPQLFIPTPSPAPAPAHTSTRNSPHPTAPQSAPLHANPHGSPTRVYLNQNVTPHLLEAMKHLVTTEWVELGNWSEEGTG